MAASVLEIAAGGGQVSLSAFATDSNGTKYDNADVVWKLADGSPGTVFGYGNYGQYTPPQLGIAQATTATVVVSVGGTSKTLAIKVTPNPSPTPDPLPNPEPPPFTGPPTGQPGLSLIAGHLGSQAHADGAGASARFQLIRNALVDRNGSLFVAESPVRPDTLFDQDTMNVRQVSATGQVSTVLAVPPSGSLALGPSTNIALDPDGNLLVYNKGNYQRVAADGTLSPGVAPVANSIYGAGQRYALVAANGSSYKTAIVKFDSSGKTTPFVGSDERAVVDGGASAARFTDLQAAAVDTIGNLYVVDGYSLRKITRDGITTTLAGDAGNFTNVPLDGRGSEARFYSISSIAATSNGVLALDSCRFNCGGNSLSLRRIAPDGTVSTLGPMPGAARLFNDLAGNTYLQRDSDILKLSANGLFDVFAGYGDNSKLDRDGSGSTARFLRPLMMAADPTTGNLVVAESAGFGSHLGPYALAGLVLRKVTPAGQVTTLTGSGGLWKAPPFGIISGLVFDKAGNLYLSEFVGGGDPRSGPAYGGAIYKVTPAGVFTGFAGWHGTATDNATQRDGAGIDARFVAPALTGIDNQGNLYVDDQGKARRITPDGVVSAALTIPAEVGKVIDSNGYSYAVDTAGSTILRFGFAHGSTTIAGVTGQAATLPGSLPASVDNPRGLVWYGSNTVAFISGNAIVKLVLPSTVPALR